MKLKFIKYIVIFAAGTFTCSFVCAQSTPTVPAAGVEITKAIPASPDAASLGKYGSIPISTYTGIPNISVPFYTIKTGQISLPISLSYHAGGNKVEEVASSVGLGWTFNAGGAIVRTIRGLPDEDIFGFLDPNHFVYNIKATLDGGSNYTNAQLNEHLNQIAVGVVDGESDIYNFNFGGYSGKFVFDNFGHIITIPKQNIQFTTDTVSIQSNTIRQFTAKTPDGTTYIFGSNNDDNDAIERTYTTSSCSPSIDKKYHATSWFIKKIVDAMGHTVNFLYNYEHCDLAGTSSETKYQFQDWDGIGVLGSAAPKPTPDDVVCGGGGGVSTVKLRRVDFEHGHLDVYALTVRNDIPGGTSKLIDSVAISGDGFHKSYHLYYANNTDSRLRLDSAISSVGAFAGTKERYAFHYSPDDGWHANTRYNQDYWGYNNGHAENTTFVPWAYFYPPTTSTPVRLPGAERKADEAAMLGGMLTAITYPTGGVTTFTYEANRESNIPFSNVNTNSPVTNSISISNDPASQYYNVINNGNIKRGVYKIYSLANTTQVNLTSSGFSMGGDSTNHITGSLVRIDTLGNTQEAYVFHNTVEHAYVPNGYYMVSIGDNKHEGYTSENTTGVKYEAVLGWSNDDPNLPIGNYVVGGLRIKQIVDYDAVNPIPINIKTYKYTLPGQNTSSGWLDFQPVYSYLLGMNTGDNEHASGFSKTTFFVRTGTSNYPLATTGGSVVGYSHVEEDFVSTSGQNGKNEYFYTNSQTEPDLSFGTGFPFAPPMNLDWRRGLLKKQITFRQTGVNQFAKLQEKTCTYSYDHQIFNNGIKAGMNPVPMYFNMAGLYYNNGDNNFATDGSIVVTPFTDYSDFTYLASDITKTYSSSDTTKFVESVNSYVYDAGSLQISQITGTNSKNEQIIKKVTYPSNYSINPFAPATGTLAGIGYLQFKGIDNVPIEEITQKQNADNSGLRTINAVLATYKAHQPLRDSVFVMRASTGISGFIESTAGGNDIIKDSHYQPVVSFDKYDNAGNILQEKKVGEAIRSYLWGYPDNTAPYLNVEPIAEVINADTSNIAYTNFESYAGNGTGLGNWTYSNNSTTTDNYAPMGLHCYTLGNNSISKSGLTPSKRYILSVWLKQGASVQINGTAATPAKAGTAKNGWVYQEYLVTDVTSVTLTGTGLIDELRLYPDNAQMSTYTYSPLLGIMAKCDIKNQFTSYSYDSAGRLILIKDQDGNILKQVNYNYSNSILNVSTLPVYSPTEPTCIGEGYKIINGVCTYGNQVYTSSVHRNLIYYCTYHYEWNDGSKSPDYKQMSFGDCSTQ